MKNSDQSLKNRESKDVQKDNTTIKREREEKDNKKREWFRRARRYDEWLE